MDVNTILKEKEKELARKQEAVEKLTAELGGLNKKKENYQKDIELKKKELAGIEEKLSVKSKDFQDALEAAIAGEKTKLENKFVELETEKIAATNKKNQAGALAQELEGKVKENTKLKTSLEAEISRQEGITKDVEQLRAKLESAVKTIQEVLK